MLFGKILKLDEAIGTGTIKSEIGNAELHFDKSAVTWGNASSPKIDRRFSYEVGKNEKGADCAVNLRPA